MVAKNKAGLFTGKGVAKVSGHLNGQTPVVKPAAIR